VPLCGQMIDCHCGSFVSFLGDAIEMYGSWQAIGADFLLILSGFSLLNIFHFCATMSPPSEVCISPEQQHIIIISLWHTDS
jgi:hypothetical protein